MTMVAGIFVKAQTLQHRPQSQIRMGIRVIISAIAPLVIFCLTANSATGQSYLTSTGQPSFAAPQPIELGFVDAATGNLHLSIPLGSYPQRGSNQPQPITLEYDSNFWTPWVEGYLWTQWEPWNSPGWHSLAGWYLSYEADQLSTAGGASQDCWTDLIWPDQNGTPHAFHLNYSWYGQAGCPSSADAFAADSSGYHMYVNPSTDPYKVYAPDGTLVYSVGLIDAQNHLISVEDTNGNYLTKQGDGFIDTLGREIGYGSAYIGWPGVTVSTSQGTAQYSFTTTTINVTTHFQQSGISDVSTQLYVLRTLTLPDAAHSTYTFTYDCDESSGNPACGSPSGRSAYYGAIISITFPTGGTTSYIYDDTFSDAYGNKSLRVGDTLGGGPGGEFGFVPSVLSHCSATQVNCQQQTTVYSPEGITLYTFQLNNGAWPISIVHKDSQGNVLSTITNTWDFSQPCVLLNCHGASYVRLLSQQTTIPSAGGNLTKQAQYTYDSPQYGNYTAIKEWKYVPAGTGFSSVPDRATYVSYLYTGTNNINRPASVTVCNNVGSDGACPGGGSRVSQTLYTYDAYGANGLRTVSGIAQHDDANFGAGNTARGNPTSISRWVSGSSYLTTSYTYDTTGQTITETDPAGNVATYGYADNFFTDSGNDTTPATYTPSQPTNAYVTSVTDAIGTQTGGYYFGSGKAAVVTDYNGASSYSHFQDDLDRQTEEIDPIGWKLATYSSATQSDMYTAVADTCPSSGCGSCQHTQTILDGFGRTVSNRLANNPIGPVNIDTTYDMAGRVATTSHPYAGASDPNHVMETYGYDLLDRGVSVTHPDGQSIVTAYGAQVAGLGGITAQLGSTSSYGYGYPQITLDETGKQQEQWIDGFGRIIEVEEPSTGSGTLATATLSVSGPYDGPVTFDTCQPDYSCPETIWNYGNITVTVSGFTAGAWYGPTGNDDDPFTTAEDIAFQLASSFNGNSASPVTAVANGATVLLTSKAPGSSSNFPFSVSETFNDGYCGYQFNRCFGGPSLIVSPASGSFSGGSGGISSSPFYTNYAYDAAGNLTQVNQGVQTRTFTYDGLGRKISETTPEGGTATYSYNTSGGGLCSGDPSNVCQRTDARGVVTTFTYDHANRLTGTAYSIPSGQNIAAMPNVCTTTPNGTSANVCDYYDQGGAAAYAIGRLTAVIDPTGSETYSHDVGGRVTQLSKIINSQTYNIGYQYDAGGDVTQITYPSGRVVQQAYNQVGQLCLIAPTASGCSGSSYYAANFSYNAPGKLTSFTYGNGVAASFTYSAPRAQLSQLAYANGNSTYFNLQYWYQQNSPNCPNGTTANNGSIQCITDGVDSGRTVNYGYDSLGRLLSAQTNGSSGFPQWGLTESYDRFGNRWSQTGTAGTVPQPSLAFGANGMNSSTTNRPNGYTYDQSGNMTVEPLAPPNTMTWDGENRMAAFQGGSGAASYSYDGNGLRVVKSVSGGTSTVSIFSGSSVIAEYDNGAVPGSPSREYIYNGSGGATTGLLAMISGGATTYYHQDHLSVRLTTDANGNVVMQEGQFPFGEQWYETGPRNSWFFTSYKRDSESGLDYALARYYDSRTGTFCSADPLAGSPGDPQSWNRYPYGRNEPIDITDPSGKNWLFSLFQDVMLALAPFTGGATLPAAESAGLMNGFDNLMNGQPPWGFGSFGGGVSLGSSWNGTPIMPYGGLTNGIQGALGLPTMTDFGPIFDAKNASVPKRRPCNSIDKDGKLINRQRFFQQLPGLLDVAKQLNVKPDYIVGLSSYESGWFDDHNVALNNLWGLTENGGNNINFKQGIPSGNSYFANRVGPFIKGSQNINDFFAGLKKEGYNSAKPGYFDTTNKNGDNLYGRISNIQKWAKICGFSF